MKKHIKNREKIDYKRYGFNDDAPLVTSSNQFRDYLDSKFAQVGDIDNDEIKHSLCHIHKDISHIHCHIEDAKNEIIDNNKPMCGCNLATKEDISRAVANINQHTDEKFDEVDFDKQFGDLNQMISEIRNN